MSTYISKKNKLDINSLEAPAFLRDFLNYELVVANVTPKTILNYYGSLRTFLRWTVLRKTNEDCSLDAIGISYIKLDDLKELRATDIHEFLSYCATQLENSATTRSNKLSALRCFFGYYTEQEPKLPFNPVAGIVSPKKEKKLPKYMTEDEARDLLEAIKGKDAIRDYCMVTLLLNCGMRLSELVGINILDIRDKKMILRGKGRKERVIFLNDACLQAINNWKMARQMIDKVKDPDALFISSQTGRRLTGRRVEQIVEKALANAGLAGKGYTPHKLRHTAATLMYQSGVADVLTLKNILGHESIITTEIYTHADQTQINEAMAHSPLAHVNYDMGKHEGA